MNENEIKKNLCQIINAGNRICVRIEPGMGSTIGLPDLHIASPRYAAWVEVKMHELDKPRLNIKESLKILRYPQLSACMRLAACGQYVHVLMVGESQWTCYQLFKPDDKRYPHMDRTGEIAQRLEGKMYRPQWLEQAFDAAIGGAS